MQFFDLDIDAEFTTLAEQQHADRDYITNLFKNAKKTPKERRTLELLNKISNEVEVCVKRVGERDVLLRTKREFKGSQYESSELLDGVQVIAKEVAEWVENQKVKGQKPVADSHQPNKIPKSPLRDFYLKAVTNLLDKYELCQGDFKGINLPFVLNQIEKYFTTWTTHHLALVAEVTDPQSLEQLEGEFEAVSDRFQLFILMAEQSTEPEAEAPVNSNPGSGNLEQLIASLVASSTHHPKSDFRLPRIELPKFGGDLDNWKDFKERFEAMVNQNSRLQPVEKMHYLKDCLVGEALDAVKNLALTQYDEAWSLISKRYQNNKVLTFHELKSLLSLSSAGEESADLKRLLDQVKVIRFNLSDLRVNIREWNAIFVFIVSQRLPRETFAMWEQSLLIKDEVPEFDALDTFIEGRIQTLMATEKRQGKIVRSHVATLEPVAPPVIPFRPIESPGSSSGKPLSAPPLANSNPCVLCAKKHPHFKCPRLLPLSSVQRKQLIHQHHLCDLCFNLHQTEACTFKWRCRICKGKHNTAIHTDSVVANFCDSGSNVLLATAMIKIWGANGRSRTVRVLIDQGSQSSFISQEVARDLHLKFYAAQVTVGGIGGNKFHAQGATTVHFRSVFEDREFTVDMIILPKVVTVLNEIFSPLPESFNGLQLADEQYWKGGRVDAIFGADVFHDLLMDGMAKDSLLAQRTHVGWILSGRTEGMKGTSTFSCVATVDNDLDKKLQLFWETEEKVAEVSAWTPEQQAAENFFVATTTRNEQGRFVCRLPLKEGVSLGSSRRAAIGNLFQLEKRFKKDPLLKERYVVGMREYISCGHAVAASFPPPELHCYLPHLAVLKEASLTTKTRIVFNASSPTSNKRSLNDNLLIGPVVQRDLAEKVIRFRLHPFVFVCDIEKMYRMINMHQGDWDLQRFVWREDETEPISDYCLTTVTFGQASAPFTATRTLVQLAYDVQNTYPLASKVLLEDTYVDDLHFGAQTLQELHDCHYELTNSLHSAGFSLKKWSCNLPEFMKTLSVESSTVQDTQSFLGINWTRSTDQLSYPKITIDEVEHLSKRKLLADISSSFDPLGWSQPIIIPAKLLLQSLWKRKFEWDDQLPEDIRNQWRELKSSLSLMHHIRIPRWIGYTSTNAELHGFCDSSEKAYGAVIFIRTSMKVHQLIAKSRVAPVSPMTIPRLELKGAVLLAELMAKVRKALPSQLESYYWCDSRVVLHWIMAEPFKWQPFIRNRTAFIREHTNPRNWMYIKSADNPADLISRGCTFHELVENSLWFNGPPSLIKWTRPVEERLSEKESTLVQKEVVLSRVLCYTATAQRNVLTDLMARSSSFHRICRIIAWILRFLKPATVEARMDFLSPDEVAEGERRVIRHLQLESMEEDIKRLSEGRLVGTQSKIRSLSPFLDKDGCVRVGGRLINADLPFDTKHPRILLHHPILDSLIKRHHFRTLHGGPALTLASLRKEVWIINGIRYVKKVVRSCIVCHRFRPQLLTQMMATLPNPRVRLDRPFLHSGVDFAGPVTLKAEVGRGSRNYKSYIAVFVCLSTKAIHLEVVVNLSTDAFMSALRRFVARRGPVAHMYSDNGTNNVGAFRRLDRVQQQLGAENIRWSFIPPAAPHFGGLWEAGVKSMKTHLKKVLGNTTCTFEELSTIVYQVEAVLNSRPLCPLSNDPGDLDALTPMHFLTGHVYVPIVDETDLPNAHFISRYEKMQLKYQEVCDRYKTEYLTRLQNRPKWLKSTTNVKIGQLVLVQEDNLATTKWPLARIVETHKGADGLVRVVTLKTSEGSNIMRPIAKISPLPMVDVPEETGEYDSKRPRRSPRIAALNHNIPV